MTGRPSDYTPEIATAICDRIANGESLRAICQRADMPARSTVFLWLAGDRNFSDQYARAREVQADLLVDEILEIADTPEEGERHEEGENKEGSFSKTIREDMLGHRRLQVDARKWAAGKLAPKKYGDKFVLGGDGANPVEHILRIEREIVDIAHSDSPRVPATPTAGEV